MCSFPSSRGKVHYVVGLLLFFAVDNTLCSSSLHSPTVALRSGHKMPVISLGNSGGCHPDVDGTEKKSCSNYNATIQALSIGYRGFHAALSYGNQAGVGAAVKDYSIHVPRQEVFLMTMVPKYLMGYNETLAAVEASLTQLQVSYLDLVMVHHRAASFAEWPRKVQSMAAFPDNWARQGSPTNNKSDHSASWAAPDCALKDGTWLTCQDETWQALVDLRNAGTIRDIGVSNWMVSNLKRMKRLGQELPAVNQIEQHVGWWDQELIQWCEENGVVVQAATPLARAHPSLVQFGDDPVVSRAATLHRKTPAQISLKFLVQKGITAVPNAASASYQTENIDIFDFNLTSLELLELGTVPVTCRTCIDCFKCWGDPAALMCVNLANGTVFHCP